jgi:hypothetical protein
MSKIEVNEIDAQSGSTITVGSACKSVAVPGNVVKTNAIQASDAGNIISQSGTTITLGASGDTIALSAGASQTGFGRTGTVDWNTTPKTATFSAVSGDGFFCNTTGGAFTCNLPAGSAGAIVSLADYAGTWQTHSLTVAANGTEKIGGIASAPIALNTEGQSVTFVYVDSTQGWINVQDSTSNERGSPFVSASGGTETTSGNFKIHTFTGPGTFTVSSAGAPSGSTTVDYLVIAGGAGGASGYGGGGGGAGGYRESSGAASGCYSRSPLGACVAALPVSVQGYPITVGAGSAGATSIQPSSNGSDSTFSTITSAGGGSTGYNSPGQAARSGGSGGGGTASSPNLGGNGNTPPVSPPQGNPGGTASTTGNHVGSGGGGASAAGQAGTNTGPGKGGDGGDGQATSITGSSVTRAGGGGGSRENSNQSLIGLGGAGGGGNAGIKPGSVGQAGSANTGGGGGASGGVDPVPFSDGGAGGSGIVVIRYRYQ